MVIGHRLGPYVILAKLGEGGMGEVFRARDGRLNRDVAIKILPAAFASDPDRVERFSQEARAAAALNHPNILSVFDIVTDGASPCIVSELLEGESLRDRLSGGPLPARKAIDIAIQIATGLAAAHEKGIVHRDLKPENTFITTDGRAKVLDFGLAKLTQPEPALAGMSTLPTTPPAGIPASPKTVPGMVMGTVGYMAPEQVRGMATDSRTDIFALGLVLYEMLTGRRAFTGETTADVMSAILRASPPEIGTSAAVPPALLRIVDRCLEKQPGARFQSARDLAFALESLTGPSGASGVVAPPANRRWLRWTAAAVAAIALVALGAAAMRWSAPAAANPTQRVSLVLPPEHPVVLGWTPGSSIAIAPDGRTVVYVGAMLNAPPGPARKPYLFVRALDSREVRQLPGTDNPRQPFFSPDGRWVGFFGSSDGAAFALKKVPVSGGTAVTLVDRLEAGQWATGAWLDDGTIVIGGTPAGLLRVPDDGGTPQAVTRLAVGERVHHEAVALPGGRDVLFTKVFADDRLPVLSVAALANRSIRLLIERASSAQYVPGGYLLFSRDDVLQVATFDAASGVVGTAVPLSESVRHDSGSSSGRPEWSVSSTGTLAYVAQAGEDDAALVLVAPDGRATAVGERADYRLPSASPDGSRIAVAVVRGQKSEIRIIDPVRGTTTRLPGDDQMSAAVWRPNGRELAVASTRPEGRGIWLRDVDSGAERPLVAPNKTDLARNMSWSPDGAQLVYTKQRANEHTMWIVKADGSDPRPLLPGAGRRHTPRISPDGEWVAYVSDESGRSQVYVERLTGGARVQVSLNRGIAPAWSHDGRALFFEGAMAGGGGLLRVDVSAAGGTLRTGTPRLIVNGRVTAESGAVEVYHAGNNVGAGYAVLPDGRFVMVRGADPQDTREIVLVQHFAEEAKRLTAPGH